LTVLLSQRLGRA